MEHHTKIFVAGHKGLVGSAIVRLLKAKGYQNILTRSRADLDLTDSRETHEFFHSEKPEYVFLAAAKVGGILANSQYPADFIQQNIDIQRNIILESYRVGVRRLLFLGSSCIYPKYADMPITEDQLMSGPLEPTNAPYATAKIAGIEMCWAYNRQYRTHFLPVMPCNLYGPNDNFDLQHSHVLPALIRKFHLAKLARQGAWADILKDQERFGPIEEDFKRAIGMDPQTNQGVHDINPQVIVWGSGSPRREFLLSDDMAEACLMMMNLPWDVILGVLEDPLRPLFNVGAGTDVSIKQLAGMISDAIGYQGNLVWNTDMPDGVSGKLLDTTRLKKLGWQQNTELEKGIRQTYQWYLDRT